MRLSKISRKNNIYPMVAIAYPSASVSSRVSAGMPRLITFKEHEFIHLFICKKS
ncbi:exported protein of unknown function [Tepidanaerobacter acetatoxydans Re1]|uniref:Uncharacterized protein n=1 Tax=Tepidanaerobacter acetatoxydans (strain DSM 21804 / JCM 16047 / Re1) TaxID=1209989 RepID=U4QL64_TEPAE|nr:exported protein of unknown function [Tepidanaerobacter acetatoxydans Re1]